MKDRELTGVVVETKQIAKANGKMGMVCVHWFTDGVKWWCGEHKVEMVKKCP